MPYREKIIFQLAALAALFLLPIGLVVGILISVEDAAINIARSEQAGAGYLRALGPVLKAVEVHQYDRSVDLSGIADDLKAAQARFGAKIDASAAARAAIDDAVIANNDPASLDKIMKVQADVLALIARIGESSNLILDDQLDTYYLCDVLLNHLPSLLDQLPDLQISAGDPAKHDDFLTALGAVATNHDGLDASITAAFANDPDGSTKAALGQLYPAVKDRLEATMARIKSTAKVDGAIIGPIMERIDALNIATVDQLTARLRVREASLTRTERLAVGGSVLLFILFAAMLSYRVTTHITGPLERLTEVMQQLAGGQLDVAIPALSRRDEIGRIARAVEVFKQNAVEVRRLGEAQRRSTEDAEKQRAALLDTMARTFEAGVSGVINEVRSSCTDVEDKARRMAEQMQSANGSGQAVVHATAETTNSVQIVAAAAEQLYASVREIAQRVTESATIAGDTAIAAQNSTGTIKQLADQVQQINNIVGLITTIASQTNLLALNATIESARAGEAGRGFAVVANEVKRLAAMTAQATDEITRNIGEVQTSARLVVNEITHISAIATQSREIASSISAAVEEQSSATSEISKSIAHAAAGVRSVADNIADVGKNVMDADSLSRGVLSATVVLGGEFGKLQEQVGNFLTTVRRG